ACPAIGPFTLLSAFSIPLISHLLYSLPVIIAKAQIGFCQKKVTIPKKSSTVSALIFVYEKNFRNVV
ncbi:hypothetical protein ACLI1Z_17305, partial [Enterococcus faecalis]|uniref:hypothetical protein n=1 Tax=Enterococcus faecalis TaxID=1351 RepID=UPI00398566B9